MSNQKITGLQRAIAADPDNVILVVMLAEAQASADEFEAAARTYGQLLDRGALDASNLRAAGQVAARAEAWSLLDRIIAASEELNVVDGMSDLKRQLDEAMDDHGVLRLVKHGAAAQTEPVSPRSWLHHRGEVIRFDDVGGLSDVKKTINRMVILPHRRPELYEKYGRKKGGGVLLFGPPGCGKTMLARATAGECELPFLNVRIEQILDPYFGMSERNLHDAFEEARAHAPCVLFLDELDAIAFSRSKNHGMGRSLVDQLLQELDSMGSDNDNILTLAATNAPWDVDDALKRPGRFDRVVFVPPPDDKARRRILELCLGDRPTESIDTKQLSRATRLFSGADLRGLVERAIDEVIDEAIDTNSEPPLRQEHLSNALQQTDPSTLEWLARARNYVEFANRGDRYKDVERFLKSREAKSHGKL